MHIKPPFVDLLVSHPQKHPLQLAIIDLFVGMRRPINCLVVIRFHSSLSDAKQTLLPLAIDLFYRGRKMGGTD